MPNISFATGGDGEESQFVGYVAKDSRNRRECHIFDCYGKAPDIIATGTIFLFWLDPSVFMSRPRSPLIAF